MEKKAIDCMVQHIKTFSAQSFYAAVADFGEPCQTCPYIGKCNLDWLSIMEPLLDQATIPFSAMVHRARLSEKEKK